MKHHPLVILAILLALAPWAHTQAAPTPSSTEPARSSPAQVAMGSIEGRVQNAATGEYIQGARLSIAGTSHVTYTDSDGSYGFSDVPAGEVTVEAFYTGQTAQSLRVTVPSGGSVQLDVTFSAGSPPATDGVTKLDKYTVATSREMSGASVAINEQRFAPNLRTVLSADEFGTIVESNVGEFMKFMPGVNIEHAGGNARGVSLNGVPGPYVPITYGGFALASATGNGAGDTSRQVALDTVSINNLSRVEVTFSPTPESPGSALAGTVNFVPRSSFERAKPVLNFSANLTMREDARHWGSTPAPFGDNRKIHPGADFSYIAPINKRLGVTVAGGFSKVYSAEPQVSLVWRGAQAATNGTSFPNTPVDQPYLTSVAVKNSQKQSDRSSFSASVDYRLSPADRITASVMTSTFDVETDNNVFTAGITGVAPGNFTPHSTQGNAGAGTLTLARSGATRTNLTYMPSLLWRHEGSVWKNEAGYAYSHSENHSNNGGSGVGEYFGGINATRTGVTVGFADIGELGPQTITVADSAGRAINPYTIDNYTITTASRNIRSTVDVQETAFAKTRRDFYGVIPLSLTTGLDLRRGTRDLRASTPSFTYLGPDGLPGTPNLPGGDNAAAPFIDSSFSRYSGPYFPNRFDAVNSSQFYDRYVGSPSQFRVDPNAIYRSEVSNSKWAQELVSATYLRADLSFFSNRLKLVGGVRVEQTNIRAEGPLSDPTRNILRDAQGQPILVNGKTQPVVTDPLAASQLTFLSRGARSKKEYLRWFPSVNATYNLRENLILRAAYATSIGRPNFNQYAGGVTLPDPANPLPTDVITVSNVGLKPWSARSYTARIEYYFAGVGELSAGVFRRNITDFFGSTRFAATPEFLALYNIDPAVYGGYPVATQYNLTTGVRIDGYNLSYRQALTFLPNWARGVQVFANYNSQRLLGSPNGDFAAFIPKTINWGVSLNRGRVILRANWNYRGKVRGALNPAGPGIAPGTFDWVAARTYLDLNGEYRFTRRLSVFVSVRDVLNAATDNLTYGPDTPAYARLSSRAQWGSLWTFGIKGTF